MSLATTAAGQQPSHEQHAMKPTPAFATLSTLVGEWEGRTPDGAGQRRIAVRQIELAALDHVRARRARLRHVARREGHLGE
jgi:hypothetical protein